MRHTPLAAPQKRVSVYVSIIIYIIDIHITWHGISGEHIAACVHNCSNSLAIDPDKRNADTAAVYSECSRPRRSTAPNVDTTLYYSYACVHTRMDEAALSADRPLHKHTAHSAYATVAEEKTESEDGENTYSSASQNRVVFRNPDAQRISDEKDEHIYTELPETNTTFFCNEAQTISPTVSTAFQLGARYSSRANSTCSLKSLPIEEQLYNIHRSV